MTKEPASEVEHEQRLGRRLLEAFSSSTSYGRVLLLIVLSYILAISLHKPWGTSVVLAVQITTVWFALRTSHARRTARVVADLLLAYAAFVAVVDLFIPNGPGERAFIYITASLLYLIAPFSILRHLISRKTVDIQTVLGALAAYLLIGMFFAFIYQSIAQLQQQPFFGAQGVGTFPQDLFFSFTTLTTTGYGNLVPAQNPGQSLAVLEMLTGQLFLVTAVAKVVNAWQPASPSSPPLPK